MNMNLEKIKVPLDVISRYISESEYQCNNIRYDYKALFAILSVAWCANVNKMENNEDVLLIDNVGIIVDTKTNSVSIASPLYPVSVHFDENGIPDKLSQFVYTSTVSIWSGLYGNEHININKPRSFYNRYIKIDNFIHYVYDKYDVLKDEIFRIIKNRVEYFFTLEGYKSQSNDIINYLINNKQQENIINISNEIYDGILWVPTFISKDQLIEYVTKEYLKQLNEEKNK